MNKDARRLAVINLCAARTRGPEVRGLRSVCSMESGQRLRSSESSPEVGLSPGAGHTDRLPIRIPIGEQPRPPVNEIESPHD